MQFGDRSCSAATRHVYSYMRMPLLLLFACVHVFAHVCVCSDLCVSVCWVVVLGGSPCTPGAGQPDRPDPCMCVCV